MVTSMLRGNDLVNESDRHTQQEVPTQDASRVKAYRAQTLRNHEGRTNASNAQLQTNYQQVSNYKNPHNRNQNNGQRQQLRHQVTFNSPNYNYNNNNNFTETCKYCGGFRHYQPSRCPAKGIICHSCGKRDHFSRMCQSKNRHVREVDDDSAVYLGEVSGNSKQ
ncbi:Uncharacterised protein at_DN2081 [Pycnogonum litorale]